MDYRLDRPKGVVLAPPETEQLQPGVFGAPRGFGYFLKSDKDVLLKEKKQRPEIVILSSMLYGVIIPILLLFVPWLLVRFVFATKQTKGMAYKKYALYLWLAAGVWALSQIPPDVHVSPQTDTFTMHTMGGVAAALLFVYAAKSYQIRFEAWWQAWVALYLFVSGLGVLNELFEFFLSQTQLANIVGGDEWWDLTANTLGGFVTYGLLSLLQVASKAQFRGKITP